jgi:hypothetical protein
VRAWFDPPAFSGFDVAATGRGGHPFRYRDPKMPDFLRDIARSPSISLHFRRRGGLPVKSAQRPNTAPAATTERPQKGARDAFSKG